MKKKLKLLAQKFKKFRKSKHFGKIVTVIILLTILCCYIAIEWAEKDMQDFSKHGITPHTYESDGFTYRSYSEFEEDLHNEKIDIIFLRSSDYMLYTLKNEELANLSVEERKTYLYDAKDVYKTPYIGSDNYRLEYSQYGAEIVTVSVIANYSIWSAIFSMVIPTAWVFLMMFWMMRLVNIGGKFDVKPVESDVKFEDIIGHDEAIEDLKGIVYMMADYAKTTKATNNLRAQFDKGEISKEELDTKMADVKSRGETIGYTPSKGILLSGPAGVGKTMMAKAIAGEAGLPFYSVNGSDFVEMYVGNGARKVRELFKQVRKHTPCVLFIDEFDALAVDRDNNKTHDEAKQTVNAFLKEMDGVEGRDGIFVLAATNYSDNLDKAAIRSGRFDREIQLRGPRDWKVRLQLFEKYMEDKKLEDGLSLEQSARVSAGMTGADIATICNEAAFIALKNELDYIDQACINEAIDVKVFKGSRSKAEKNKDDLTVIAYHEAGHAVMTYLMGNPISRASIIGTINGVGGAVYGESTDRLLEDAEDFLKGIRIAMAGRIAEVVKFKKATTGASNDIEQATKQLYSYVFVNGFHSEFTFLNATCLKKLGVTISKESDMLNELSSKLYSESLELIKENYTKVEELAKELLDKGELSGSEVVDILSK